MTLARLERWTWLLVIAFGAFLSMGIVLSLVAVAEQHVVYGLFGCTVVTLSTLGVWLGLSLLDTLRTHPGR